MNSAFLNRRHAAVRFASWLAASPWLAAQQVAGEPEGRIAPANELVNSFEFEAMARRRLSPAAFAEIAGDIRQGFDRITLRPRMMVNALELDLTTGLFGARMFAPLIAGPVAEMGRFHPDGEMAMLEGTSAAKTVMVVSSRSSVPLEKIAARTKAAWWYQTYPEPEMTEHALRAVGSGCKAVCVTARGGLEWKALDRLRQSVRVPVLLKGVMNAEDAADAVANGLAGIVVSNHGAKAAAGLASPIDMLPSIADAVGGKIPVLVDGGFRRGTDILKGIALGASAVLVARPAVWALGAYGAEGVRILFEMLQAELARNMAMCGRVTVRDIDRSLVQLHRR